MAKPLACCVDVSSKLLQEAGEILDKRPGLALQIHDCTRAIEIELPTNWKLGMCRLATHIRMRMNEDGALFELQEIGSSVSGGWIGSCMPSSLVTAFLRKWIAHARSRSTPMQIDLFLEPA